MDDTTPLPEPAAAGSTSPRPSGPAWDRLEDQLGWHDREAKSNQQWYRGLKVGQIASAAAIPVMAAAGVTAWVVGGMGALVVVIEGVSQLYGFHDAWLNYRSTSEGLGREKSLFLAAAPPYADVARPDSLLAERVEAILSRQHTEWTASQLPHEGRPRNE